MTDLADLLDDLVARRNALGLTTGQVAQRMGVTQSAVSQIEHANNYGRTLTVTRLLAYANALGAQLEVVTA